MKNIILLISLMISTQLMAINYDASKLPQSHGFLPSVDTIAYRAGQNATNALTKANSVEGIANSAAVTAQEANGIAKGTRAVLVNQSGCVYNSNFPCTNDNLTYQYRTTNHSAAWRTPGSRTWTVPTGVTSVYATVISGQGEGGTSGYTYKNGRAGGYSRIKSVSASAGAGGLRVFGDGAFGKAGLQNTRAAVFSVSAGETLYIVVGRGGAGGGSNGAGGRGWHEPHDSDGGSAYEPGNPGANGSVSISYVKNIRIN